VILWRCFRLRLKSSKLQVRDNTFLQIPQLNVRRFYTPAKKGYTPLRFSPGRLLLSFSANSGGVTSPGPKTQFLYCNRKKWNGAMCSGQDPECYIGRSGPTTQRGVAGKLIDSLPTLFHNFNAQPCGTRKRFYRGYFLRSKISNERWKTLSWEPLFYFWQKASDKYQKKKNKEWHPPSELGGTGLLGYDVDIKPKFLEFRLVPLRPRFQATITSYISKKENS